MKDKGIKEIIITTVSLFLICAVAAGVLGAVNMITAPAIADIQQKAADEAKANVLPAAVTFDIAAVPDAQAYEGRDAAGALVGYVFVTSASSYGGKLELMTGVDLNGSVTGINILTIDDTPGLGMNAKRDEFRNQYVGKSGELTVVKGSASGDEEIAAITSATITSKAVTSCVNQALALFAQVAGKEG